MVGGILCVCERKLVKSWLEKEEGEAAEVGEEERKQKVISIRKGDCRSY